MRSDFLYKIVAVGSGGVGKTALIRRFAEGKFAESYLPTLGIDITTKRVRVKDRAVKLICVDTAGQEYFGRLRPQYYRGASGAFVVFDLTKKSTFDDVPKWLEELRQHTKDEIPMILVGNKLDLDSKRVVTKEEADRISKEENMTFYETSALSGHNVEEMFQKMTSNIVTIPEEEDKND